MNLCAPDSTLSLQQASTFSRALNVAGTPLPDDSGAALQTMLQRFCSQFNALARHANELHDVAVVFLAPGHAHRCAQDSAVHAHFQQAHGTHAFEPFDSLARQSPQSTLCYILRPLACETGDDFNPYYCAAGSPTCATRHYRIEFESLLRTLFAANYRYVMKKANLR
jgi:hypothetical protein